jgi:hypothetical protein
MSAEVRARRSSSAWASADGKHGNSPDVANRKHDVFDPAQAPLSVDRDS